MMDIYKFNDELLVVLIPVCSSALFGRAPLILTDMPHS